jgi:hypothetical protein
MFIGTGLIAVGALLLLRQMHFVNVEWHILFWAAIAALGIYRLVLGFMRNGEGMFFGTIVTAVGIYEVLRLSDLLYIPEYLLPATILALAGAGFLMTFFAAPRRWHLAIPGCILIGIGILMLLTEEGYFNRWEVIDFVHDWWPLALILFGVALILNRNNGGFPWKKHAPDQTTGGAEANVPGNS